MTGGEIVVKTLQSLGVKAVFGIPSVHNLPIVDALGRFGTPSLFVARHEQGATTMADGYARAANTLGVALTSTGPGAANSMGSMYEAEQSSTPLLQITGQVPTHLLGRGKGTAHEVRDQGTMLGTVSRAVFRPTHVNDLAKTLQHAAGLALSGHQGPVAVEIPIDVQYAKGSVDTNVSLDVRNIAPSAKAITEAARMLQEAGRIAIWVGGGAVRSGNVRIAELARRLGAPVVTSMNGRGAIDEYDPACVGAVTTDPDVRSYLESCDVWLAIGNRFRSESTDEWQLRPPRALIHVNIDPSQKDRNMPAALFIAADAKLTVDALLEQLDDTVKSTDVAKDLHRKARVRAEHDLGTWATVLNALEQVLPGDTVLVRDATMAAYSFGNRFVRIHGRGQSIYPAGIAIGLGLPLAIGAKAARPNSPVVVFCGDGGFMLNASEMATAMQYNLSVVILLFNDHGYDVLRRNQDRLFEGRHFAVDLHTPDFQMLACAFGLKTMRVASAQAFGEALKEAIAMSCPVFLEVDVTAIGPIPRLSFRV